MNDAGVEVLVQAALKGTKQIQGQWFFEGAYCAQGLLLEAANPGVFTLNRGMSKDPATSFDLRREYERCPVDGCPSDLSRNEWGLLSHLNDWHGWGFLTIARKLGETA